MGVDVNSRNFDFLELASEIQSAVEIDPVFEPVQSRVDCLVDLIQIFGIHDFFVHLIISLLIEQVLQLRQDGRAISKLHWIDQYLMIEAKKIVYKVLSVFYVPACSI